jgi:alpha-beta hydrolase superfamily lysophospholipase
VTDTEHTLTDDGWRLALRIFEPPRGCGAMPRRHPVILCHGLGANHLGFDVDPDTSLARHLAKRGYLALALDLRGHGDSERPSRGGPHRFGWSFDDYLEHDVPAAIAFAKRRSGARAVHWIGHSMGGILGYAHLARGGSADFVTMTAVGSSLDYSGAPSGFHSLTPLKALLDRIPVVPLRWLARASGTLVGKVATPYERFNVWASNTDLTLWRRIAMEGFHSVSPPVMRQLATSMLAGGLRSSDGKIAYSAGLGAATAPVLALAGERDAQCPPDAARRTLEAVGSKRRELRVFGKSHGEVDDYGHFDLLMGRRAKSEVFPHIDRFLDEHD